MDQITHIFTEQFAAWDITLPAENVGHRSAGHIEQRGWLIQFCFGRDEKGEYLDYYASHRMTDDDHVRLYEDGTSRSLAAIESLHPSSADPVEAKRLEDEFTETNRKISDVLAAKGFNRFTINVALRVGFDDPDKQ